MILILIQIGVAFMLGFYIGVRWVAYQTKKSTKKYLLCIEDIFNNIKNKIKSMTFKHRLQNYVHFNLDEFIVIYDMKKKEIIIFENEICLCMSTQIVNSKVPEFIIDYIEKNFRKDIDNTTNVQGYIVSKNISDINPVSVINKSINSNNIKLSLDDILDKISINGLSSLTTEERKFLNSFSNGNK